MNDKKDIKIFAHDLLNSLAIISANLGIALKSEDLSLMRDRVLKAEVANKIAADKCNQILNVGKAKKSDIKSFLVKNIQTFRELFPDLSIQFEDHFSQFIEVQETYFFRTVENILKNSMEAGATKIVIIFSKSDLVFYDNGQGITTECIKQIKEKGTTKRVGHGIGLGSISAFSLDHGFQLNFGNNLKEHLFHPGFYVKISFNQTT